MVTERSLKALVWGDIFSQRAARRRKQEMSGFPPSKSLSLHRADSTPSLALVCPPSAPSITLPHHDQHLTLTPISLCVFFHTTQTPGFITEKASHHPSCAQTQTRITPWHWLAELLFPNQRQTAINRAPSLLSHKSLNQSVLS